MTKRIYTPKQLDRFVRERVDMVLIGKYTSTPRRLHVPETDDAEDSSCHATVQREGGWLPKSITVYPEGHHKICTPCAEARFDVSVVYNE